MTRRGLYFALPLLAAGCGDAVPMGSGMEGALRVRGGRYVAAPFPAGADADANGLPEPDASGPAPAPVVAVVQSANLTIRQGQRAKEFSGSVSFNARTVAVGLDHDRGYWLVPIDSADVDLPPNLAFRVTADFASDLPVGAATLLFAAVDAAGRVGPRRSLPLTVRSSLPDAPLAVVLDWDRPVDLDLVVRLPDGTALTSRGRRAADGTYARAVEGGARVELNSNAGCRVDGMNTESATFPAPAAGRYEVRVHLFAACGEAATSWRVRVVRAGAVVSEARGASYAFETDAPGGGPNDDGRRALVFNLAE